MKNLAALLLPAESGIHVFVSMGENGIRLAITSKQPNKIQNVVKILLGKSEVA